MHGIIIYRAWGFGGVGHEGKVSLLAEPLKDQHPVDISKTGITIINNMMLGML